MFARQKHLVIMSYQGYNAERKSYIVHVNNVGKSTGREQHVHNKKKVISLNLPALLFLHAVDLYIDTFIKENTTTLRGRRQALPTRKKEKFFLISSR
jgi:hypothetical protein